MRIFTNWLQARGLDGISLLNRGLRWVDARLQPHVPEEVVPWITLDTVHNDTSSAVRAILVWESLAKQTHVTPSVPWALIRDPGGAAAYEWKRAPTLEELWMQVDTVPTPEKDGWVAVVGFGATGYGSVDNPPADIVPAVVCTALDGSGTRSYAACQISFDDEDGPVSLYEVVEVRSPSVNIDLSKWLSTIARIAIAR